VNLVNLELAAKAYDERPLLDRLSLGVTAGDRIGVVGRNGAGKTTLLAALAGTAELDSGRSTRTGGITIGYLAQSQQGTGRVRDLVFGTLPEHDWATDPRSRAVLAHLLGGIDTDAQVTQLSGGERRRTMLAAVLRVPHDLLLLDEPTNHLDAESVAWLEQHLAEYKGAVVAVTHDRYFLDNVAGWILELDRGKGIPYEGNYSSWLEQKQARLAQEARSEKGRERTIAAELEWVRTNPKGKRTKSKARLARYEQLIAEERDVKLDEVQIHIPPGPRLGEKVLMAEDLRKGFGERLLIEDLSFDLPRAGIVGVIGANGAGKTTLFRMITGEESPDGGSIELGDTVQLAYVDQSRDALDPAKTVWEEISEGYEHLKVGEREVNSRQYTAGFNFKGSDQQARIGSLSGGERNRVHLAKLLRSGGNLLLLDEPTNDLDVDTLRALENALLEFPGCAVIISHDRWFLDRVATHVLAFEGDSHVTWFEGNFEAYEEHRHALLGAAADRPHRITYKRLVRG
jgi:energy-dependent translational throttle protein EttA